MTDVPAFRWALDRLEQLSTHSSVDPDVRIIVRARARNACEYCLIETNTQFHVDHIVPKSLWLRYLAGSLLLEPLQSDREADHIDNFAWSCPYCNQAKGNRVSGRAGRQTSRLFHPRRDRWEEHFFFDDDYLHIRGLSEIGRATEQILGFNDSRHNGPAATRHKAILDGIYPPPWARAWGY
jgi:5-methylcytosine-specific restriction endonuclease McrA